MPSLVSIPIESDQKEMIAEVRKFYRLPNDESVKSYLLEHKDLSPLVIQAVPYLRRYFVDTVFALRVCSDDQGWETLYADALWPGNAEEAVAALDAFEDAWWIAKSSAASGDLTFTYRLI